jgi:threonine aldolase
MFKRRRTRRGASAPPARLLAEAALAYVRAIQDELDTDLRKRVADTMHAGGRLMMAVEVSERTNHILLTLFEKDSAKALRVHYASLRPDGSVESGAPPVVAP